MARTACCCRSMFVVQPHLAPGLRTWVDGGIGCRGEVVCWAPVPPSADDAPGPFFDLTGWECSHTDFHLEDFVPVDTTYAEGPLLEDLDSGLAYFVRVLADPDTIRGRLTLLPTCPEGLTWNWYDGDTEAWNAETDLPLLAVVADHCRAVGTALIGVFIGEGGLVLAFLPSDIVEANAPVATALSRRRVSGRARNVGLNAAGPPTAGPACSTPESTSESSDRLCRHNVRAQPMVVASTWIGCLRDVVSPGCILLINVVVRTRRRADSSGRRRSPAHCEREEHGDRTETADRRGTRRLRRGEPTVQRSLESCRWPGQSRGATAGEAQTGHVSHDIGE